MIIFKKSIRDLWINRWQSLSVILVVASGVALLSGFNMAFKSLYYTRDKFYNELNFADLELLFTPTDISSIPDFSDIDGVVRVEKRLLFPGTIIMDNGDRISGILMFLESSDPQINSLRVIDGKHMNNNDEFSVVIERSLSKYQKFNPGDKIKIKVGEKIYNNDISGVVITPEFMTGTSNPDFFAPGKGTLGVIYGNINRTKTSLGFTLINDLLFIFSKEAEPEQIKDLILEKISSFDIEKVILKEDHFSNKYMKYILDGFDVYIPAIILIMGLLSFTTTLIIYNRFIINQQKEIGTFLSLGYRRKDIIKSYLLSAAILGLTGTILGLFVSLIVRNIFGYVQYLALELPVLYTKIYFKEIMKGFIFGVVITLIPPFLLLSKLLKSSPHEIIRTPIKQNAINKNLLTVISEKLSFLSLELRYAIRNIIRQKRLSISTILCIGLCLGIAISYITTVTSIDKTVRERLAYEQWDLCADFFYPMYLEDIDLIKEIPGIKQYEPFIRRFVEIGYEKTYKDSNLLGINLNSRMKRIKLVEGRLFSKDNEEEIIINHDIANAIGIGLGNEVDIKINKRQFKLNVVGICSEIAVGQSLVPFSLAQKLFEIPEETTGLFLETWKEYDLKTIINQLNKFEYIGSVTKKRSILIEYLKQINQFFGIVHIATVFSILVAIIFIYTNTNLIVFERIREFALLKSLGYTAKSIRKIIFSYVLIIGFVGTLVGIPIAILTATFLNHRFGKAWYSVTNYFIIKDFIWINLIALLLMPLMAIPALNYIQRFELSEILHQKSIE